MPIQRFSSLDSAATSREPSSNILIFKTALSHPDLRPTSETSTKIDEKESWKDGKKRPKKKKRNVLSANLILTRYNLVKQVCSDHGFNITDNASNECMLIWSDSAVPIEKISELKAYQKINHFAGMGEICRKDSLSRNMWKIGKLCPDEFDFVPKSWVLPGEYAMLQFHVRENRKKRPKTYIRKPVNGSMGRGIWLTRNIDKLHANDSCIIQEYLEKPLLMDGYKFDLRMYVLVLSCDPLKVFLYKDGLVRMGTVPYLSPNEVNVSNSFMHLTNYSINKHSQNFVQTSKSEQGSKRTLKYFWKWLKEKDGNDTLVWNKIADVIIKTLLVCMPHLFHAYHICRGGDPGGSNCCFEILGFDILIDRKYKPWVIEVNRAPSFGADQDLDFEIKYGVLSTTLKLLNIKTSDKREALKAEKVQSQKRLVGCLSRKPVDESNVTGNRKKLLQKRKKELKWRLSEIRDQSQKKEYEDKNCGDFVCIFPPTSNAMLEHYNSLLSQCTKAITGQTSIRRVEHNPLLNLKEEEILDLLQEVEHGISNLVDEKGRLVLKGPTPLSPKRNIAPAPSSEWTISRPSSEWSLSRPSSRVSLTNRISPTRSRTQTPSVLTRPKTPTRKLDTSTQPGVDEVREQDTMETLKMLLEMKIKFPGKTDEEAKTMLCNIQENWEFHRPRVATYWLVKLDGLKRSRVIDIVKSNVNIILKKVWKMTDIETLMLCRMFQKLFNQLLWSHGQGLWNCFNSTRNSWESIFMKSSEQFLQSELDCCRQVVELCCDCLLVVYLYASESNVCSAKTCELKLASIPISPLDKIHSSLSHYNQDVGTSRRNSSPSSSPSLQICGTGDLLIGTTKLKNCTNDEHSTN